MRRTSRGPEPAVALPSSQRVAGVLRARIVEGELRAGAPLREEALSAELDVSRNTLREAFALLTADGLVVRRPYRGSAVRVPHAVDVTDLYRSRRVIEPACLRQPYADPSAVTAMRAAVTRGQAGRDAGDLAEVGSANQAFHRAVVRLAGSEHLSRHMEGLLAEMRLVFATLDQDPAFHATFLDDNDRICALVESGRGHEAADQMWDYLTVAEGRLLAEF